MLGRRKTSENVAPAPVKEGPGKNQPTPKRREVEAARRQPLVAPTRPTGKGKGGKATKEEKVAAREARVVSRQRMMAGEEKYLPVRDRGPVRKFARDFVDARWNVGEVLLPVMFLFLILSFLGNGVIKNQSVFGGLVAATYVLVLMSAVDAFWMQRRAKKALRAKFGDAVDLGGIAWYCVMRSFQIRRTRVPRALVKRGEFPV
ncbi:DUF3043 domain-containing protein [Angustibacter luteus]|uniref:DUF3043 domain-containing protein n=1 Tax=Angustibacter luteus TaxID=658456 RepID=A0ABW1JAS8_9ACTN